MAFELTDKTKMTLSELVALLKHKVFFNDEFLFEKDKLKWEKDIHEIFREIEDKIERKPMPLVTPGLLPIGGTNG